MTDKQGQKGLNGSPRVLVVEDHVDTLALLGKLLARISIDAISTQDCATARSAAARWGRVDLVIAGFSLPGGNGAELLVELEEQSGCRTIVVCWHPRAVVALT